MKSLFTTFYNRPIADAPTVFPYLSTVSLFDLDANATGISVCWIRTQMIILIVVSEVTVLIVGHDIFCIVAFSH